MASAIQKPEPKSCLQQVQVYGLERDDLVCTMVLEHNGMKETSAHVEKALSNS